MTANFRPPQRRDYVLALGLVFLFAFVLGLAILAIHLIFADAQWSNYVVAICAVVGIIIALIGIVIALIKPEVITSAFRDLGDVLYESVKKLAKGIWESKVIRAISLVLNLLLLLLLIHPWSLIDNSSIYPCQGKGICVGQVKDGQQIGVSDGHYYFWPGSDTNNAEKSIYTENGMIGRNLFVTIVVITTLSSGSQQIEGQDELQGAYVFQHEINAGCQLPHARSCVHVKLLVANAGNDLQYAQPVAQQIAYLKQQYGEPIIGVVGMPLSTPGAIDAIHYLSGQGIPIVSSTESSDALPVTPLYFRVAPLDSRQGLINAQFVQTYFPKVKRIALFYASDNSYSLTLATSFGNMFSKNGDIIFYERFQRLDDSPQRNAEIGTDVTDIVNKYKSDGVPDLLIFCACYSDDLNSLLTDLRGSANGSLFQNTPIDSGDGAYNLGGYNSTGNQSSNYRNIYYSAFAFPDEWQAFDVSSTCSSFSSPNPALVHAQRFFCDYANDFDLFRMHTKHPYGYIRADSQAILIYDAIAVFVTAFEVAEQHTGSMPSADQIQQALLGADGCSNFQGVSGQITFSVEGTTIKKPLLMLSVNTSGEASPVGGVQGQLQVTDALCQLGAG